MSKTINFYDKYWDKALKNSHELIGNISVVKSLMKLIQRRIRMGYRL